MNSDDIQNIFLQECDEGLTAAEDGLIQSKSGNDDPEVINSIFRAVHSIKGGAGAFGFTELQAFTHHFETVLAQVREGERPLTEDLLGTLFSAFDMLADHVAAIKGEQDKPDDAALTQILHDISESLPGVQAKDEANPASPETAPAEPSAVADLDFDLDSLLSGLGDEPAADDDSATAVDDDNDIQAAGWTIMVKPDTGAMDNGGEPVLLLRELTELGATCQAVDISNIPLLADFDPEAAYLGWTFHASADVRREDIEEIFDFVSDVCTIVISLAGQEAVLEEAVTEMAETKPKAEAVAVAEEPAPDSAPEPGDPPSVAAPAAAEQATPKPAAKPHQTIRVELDKLDRLVNTVGELVITQAMLTERVMGSEVDATQELATLDHLTRELQDSALAIRAQPIQSVFSRVHRIVRELENETGKRVDLVVQGEGTELDKTVLEKIGEPLTHLIRNAVDHGLETPEEREASGKDPVGTLKLSAEHRNGRILISVSDNGKGINRSVVRAKALERGIITEDARLTDEEIDNLIFAPGFSTAQTVSSISGRGVGMDVVRQNVQALGGRVSIASTPGEGSIFTLALPLTLAIADGMIVSVGDETFVIPLTHIVESLRPTEADIKSMGDDKNMLSVRGQFLPIIELAGQLDIEKAASVPTDAVLIVVETETAGSAVLMVDDIQDQRQVVIKSLETNFRQIGGVAGATILGDGQVALIMDVETLVAEARRPRLASAA